jgi:ribosomal protein S18 acetylase RimI-like enzyme
VVVLIREFREQDNAQVIALWQRCNLVVPWNDPAQDIRRKLQVDRDLFLVGCRHERIVATVMGGYDGHRGWINYLATDPGEQRKGYGRAIMQAVESRIKARGCPKINLQIRAGNTAVVAFYSALGYSVDDVIGMGRRLESDPA